MRVAIIVSRDFAEPQEIVNVVQAAPAGVEFVIRDREAYRDPDAPPPEKGKLHKTLPMSDLLVSLGVQFEVMELDSQHKNEWGDHRAAVRDELIKIECDRVIVFRTPNTKTLDSFTHKEWYHAKMWPHIRTVERGTKAKKKYRKKRILQ